MTAPKQQVLDLLAVIEHMLGKPWDTSCVWVCEKHPHLLWLWPHVWPHCDCAGPGMPPVPLQAQLDAANAQLAEREVRIKELENSQCLRPSLMADIPDLIAYAKAHRDAEQAFKLYVESHRGKPIDDTSRKLCAEVNRHFSNLTSHGYAFAYALLREHEGGDPIVDFVPRLRAQLAELKDAKRTDLARYRERLHHIEAQLAEAIPAIVTLRDLDAMMNRFLSWKLPPDFAPDAGISFKQEDYDGAPWPASAWPTGTNLFTAAQAKAMFIYCLNRADGEKPDHV